MTRRDHDGTTVDVRCVRCHYIQPGRPNDQSCVTPCVICGNVEAEYLADWLYPVIR